MDTIPMEGLRDPQPAHSSNERIMETSNGVINKSELVEIRDAVDADRPFIYASWLRGLKHGNDYFELIENEAYFKHQHDTIESILDDFEVTVKIACLKEDPAVVLGYVVYKYTRLDYVFIKKSWRSIGLARDLVPKDITTVSHITKVGVSLLRKHNHVRFNPYLT